MWMWSRDIGELARQIKGWRESKGFYTPETLETEEARNAMLGKLMLVVTEVAEAAETLRKNDFENFEEELADSVIRLLDIFATSVGDPYPRIARKMNKNSKRPYRHGKHTSL